jgi:hypothetical protein
MYHAVQDWGLGNLVNQTVCGRGHKIKPGSREAIELVPWASCAKSDQCPDCQIKVYANYDVETFESLMAVLKRDTYPKSGPNSARYKSTQARKEQDS